MCATHIVANFKKKKMLCCLKLQEQMGFVERQIVEY